MCSFQIGTTIIFGFASGAGRDAWITALISTFIGMFITGGYTLLLRLHPGMTLVEWYRKQFGMWLGTFIGWLYPLLFIYNSGRGIADLRFLIPDTLLPLTPPLFSLSLFISLIIYGLYKGIEVVGRLAGMLLPFMFILLIAEIILLLISGTFQIKGLLPIAGKGFHPIMKQVWPTGVTQSFGELIALTMIWPLARSQKGAIRAVLLSTLISGLFITVSDILAIAVLGEVIFTRSYYPLYILLRQIEAGEILDNLDVFAVVYFVLTTFFKITLYLFAAIRGIQILTAMRSPRPLIIPVCLLVLFLGMTMTDNLMEHIMGVHMTILSPYLWVPLQFVLPGLLLMTALIRKAVTRK